jgi:TetR/AcrR family transcriptional regulator
MGKTMQAAANSGDKLKQAAGELAILEAAEKLFARQGYDGVSMRGIALEAGVSKANIYHHFESKESLYLAILKSSTDETAQLIEQLAGSEGRFEERLVEFAKAHLEHLFNRKNAAKVILHEAFSGDADSSRKLSEKVFGKIYHRMTEIMLAGQDAGVLRKDLDPALCVILLMGANAFYFQAQEILKHFPEAESVRQADQFSAGMSKVLLNGMLARQSVRAQTGGSC